MAKPIFIVSYIDPNGDHKRVMREDNYQARELIKVLAGKGCADVRLHVKFVRNSSDDANLSQANLLDVADQTS